MSDEELKKRVRWAINRICKNHEHTNKTLAPLLGVNVGTLSNYRTMKNLPKASFIIKLCELFECNKEWLMTGKGRPFYKTADFYDDGINMEKNESPPGSVQFDSTQEDLQCHGMEFRISDAMTMCARVLESGTSYATALYLNIQHFDRAVQAETVVKKCQDDLKVMGASIAKMQSRMDELEKENRNLHEEIRKLKGNSGGSAPIALGMDHAAPTGTEGQEI
jgi:hypothetical protein